MALAAVHAVALASCTQTTASSSQHLQKTGTGTALDVGPLGSPAPSGTATGTGTAGKVSSDQGSTGGQASSTGSGTGTSSQTQQDQPPSYTALTDQFAETSAASAITISSTDLTETGDSVTITSHGGLLLVYGIVTTRNDTPNVGSRMAIKADADAWRDGPGSTDSSTYGLMHTLQQYEIYDLPAGPHTFKLGVGGVGGTSGLVDVFDPNAKNRALKVVEIPQLGGPLAYGSSPPAATDESTSSTSMEATGDSVTIATHGGYVLVIASLFADNSTNCAGMGIGLRHGTDPWQPGVTGGDCWITEPKVQHMVQTALFDLPAGSHEFDLGWVAFGSPNSGGSPGAIVSNAGSNPYRNGWRRIQAIEIPRMAAGEKDGIATSAPLGASVQTSSASLAPTGVSVTLTGLATTRTLVLGTLRVGNGTTYKATRVAMRQNTDNWLLGDAAGELGTGCCWFELLSTFDVFDSSAADQYSLGWSAFRLAIDTVSDSGVGTTQSGGGSIIAVRIPKSSQ